MHSRALAVSAFGVLAASVAAFGAGCTLLALDVAPCESNAECRGEFGLGSVCAADGFCELHEPHPRCAGTFPDDLLAAREAHRDTIVFGNLVDRRLETHRARENAARLAIAQANDQGGIDARNLGLVFCTIEESSQLDALSRREAARAAARYLTDIIGVPAIIGPAASSDVQDVFDEVRGDRVLVISPSATSTSLSALDPPAVSDDAPGLLWRTVPPDSLQGRAIAEDMMRPGAGRDAQVQSVAVVHESGAYGEGLATVFASAFTGSSRLFPYDGAGLAEAVARAGEADVDEVLFLSSQIGDVIAFLDAAARLPGYDHKGIFLSDAAANADVLERADPRRFPQIRGSRPAPLDPAADLVYSIFLAAYAAEYGGDDATRYSFSANAYDAAWLVAYGAAWAVFQESGTVTGDGIARGLRRLSSGEPLAIQPTSWNPVLQQLRAGRPVDVMGASGALDFDPVTEETSGDIQIWKLRDGGIVGVTVWSP